MCEKFVDDVAGLWCGSCTAAAWGSAPWRGTGAWTPPAPRSRAPTPRATTLPCAAPRSSTTPVKTTICWVGPGGGCVLPLHRLPIVGHVIGCHARGRHVIYCHVIGFSSGLKVLKCVG